MPANALRTTHCTIGGKWWIGPRGEMMHQNSPKAQQEDHPESAVLSGFHRAVAASLCEA
jgi:hypothetical protein